MTTQSPKKRKIDEVCECAVCYDTVPMAARQFKCSHQFCEDCTRNQLTIGNRNCPYCRADPITFTPPKRICVAEPGRPRRARVTRIAIYRPASHGNWWNADINFNRLTEVLMEALGA